jgi:hypothetical protein
MRLSNGGRLLLPPLACAFLSLTFSGFATAQEKGKENSDRTEKVTLQYRVKLDAFASSAFLHVNEKGAVVSGPLELHWDIPMGDAGQKKEFDDLIKKLEENTINGVEFECRGEWLKAGVIPAPGTTYKPLRVASVPRITEAGKKRINDRR